MMTHARSPGCSPTMNVMMAAVQKATRGLIRAFGEIEHLQVSKKGLGDFVSTADSRSKKIRSKNFLRPDPIMHSWLKNQVLR